MSELDFRKNVVRQHFDSATACYDALVQRYGGSGEALDDDPRYLFRGEARYYPTSTPGTYRTLTAECPLGIKFARLDATGLFVEEYEESGGDPDFGECLAQHYLSTSDGLDFSTSLGVALAFALDKEESQRSAYIAVMDAKRAKSSARFCLHDLRKVVDASRPVRQRGFVAVHHAGNFGDLKDSDCSRELGLIWYSFAVAPEYVRSKRHAAAKPLGTLYDTKGDLCAAQMIEHLHCLVANPSSQWGQEGLDHLIDALERLRSDDASLTS